MADQTFTQDYDNELLFNDGEGLDLDDLNNMQRLIRREMFDGFMLGRHFVGDAVAGNVRTFGAALRPFATLSGLEVNLRTGFLVHHTGVLSQPDYNFLPHLFAQLATPITLAAADPTNPRWDIISVKVAQLAGDSTSRDYEDASTRALSTVAQNKRRYARLTIEVTEGTPAGSPAEPAVPAGHVKIARIEVAATQTVLTTADVLDFRFPMGHGQYAIPMDTLSISVGWAYTNALLNSWGANAGGDNLYARLIPPHLALASGGGSVKRDVRISNIILLGNHAGGVAASIWADDFGDWTRTQVQTVTGLESQIATGSGARHDLDLITSHDPVWASGFKSPADFTGLAGSAHNPIATLDIDAGAGTDEVRGIIVEYFGGL